MAASNPNPTRISTPIWRLWTEFDAYEATVLLSGIFADKPGYHDYRLGLPSTDYSAGRDVAADKLGPGEKASAIDLTMSTAAMIKYTKRLDAAARARDPRLYSPAGPVLREFIGTKDGTTVYCYVLIGGKPLGVGADAGPDPGRSKTHLWHLHLSIIRKFINDAAAIDGVLSVLRGESLASWRARTAATQGDDDMDQATFTAYLTAALGTAANPTAARRAIGVASHEQVVFRTGESAHTWWFHKIPTAIAALQAKVDKAAADDAARDALTLAAVQAITSNGGPDAAPIITAINAARDELRAAYAAEAAAVRAELDEAQAEIEHLRAVLAAGAKAEADALNAPSGS